MALYIRMALYLVFGVLAGQGLVVFDQEAGTVTFRVEDLAVIVTSLVGYAATFWASRLAKRKGGAT